MVVVVIITLTMISKTALMVNWSETKSESLLIVMMYAGMLKNFAVSSMFSLANNG